VPPRRTRPPARPVAITLDGETIVADAEASLVSALVAAGHLQLARSPKFHRPRGPSCHRGGCDGCLVRLDGVPNTMACMQQAREGAKVERQNVVLSAKLDVLRATDWFFPNGMDHHRMFAGIPGMQKVMLAFARRISGLGELPDQALPVAPQGVPARSTDVLVVGAGAAGLATAIALARAKISVVVIDEQHAAGGSLLYFPRGARVRLGAREVSVDEARERMLEEAEKEGVRIELATTSLGVLEGDDWLVDQAERGLERWTARAHVVATGGHDGVPLFEGNDLPGVLSARAAGRLLRDGVLVGERPLVVGDGPFADAFAVAAEASGAVVSRTDDDTVIAARGLSQVKSALIRAEGRERKIDCDAIVMGGPVAPAFEIAQQAGAGVRHEPAGYPVVTDESGRAERHDLFAIGELLGAPLDLEAFAERATTIARSIRTVLESTSGEVHP
jgi:sarcosine oxidase subunit alpha